MNRMTFALTGALLLATPAFADDEGDIETQLVAFEEAFNAGDSAAVAALYTEDAIALPPGGPMVKGRDAIGEMWQGAIDSGLKDLDLMLDDLEVVDDMAIETSTFAATSGDGQVRGKYVVVWKKQDGTWLLHRDIWNDMPAE